MSMITMKGKGKTFMKNDLMLIGEIAEFFGVSGKAIHLYEKKGIIKPTEVDARNGYRYYSAEQVQQLNVLGFSLDEIKTVMDGGMTKEQQAWQEAMDAARYKMECLDSIVSHVQDCAAAEKITELTDDERAWLLAKMVCVEDISVRNALSEALWV